MESGSESADGDDSLGNQFFSRASSNCLAHVSSQWTFGNARLRVTSRILMYRSSRLLFIFQLRAVAECNLTLHQ